VIEPAPSQELVVHPLGRGRTATRRRLIVGDDGITFRSTFRNVTVAFESVRFVRSVALADQQRVRLEVAVSDRSLPVWTLRQEDWQTLKSALESRAPTIAIDPPPARPHRIAADAALRTGDNPVESLRTVRRAMVGRWWVQVRPWSPGFRAEAHTLSGPHGVWAGEWRPTLGEATDDAIAMIEELRQDE
jgi:hypothetical protein